MDRNGGLQAALSGGTLSLSARRAWIEINNVETAAKASLVALRKESVDRNICCHLLNIPAGSRSPQGERG